MRPWTRSRPGSAAASHSHSGLRRVGPGQLRHAGPGERIMMPVIGGRVLRVTVREGSPAWQPLLLCNGFGARLEMLQPFVDALDPQRPVIRFDMPGLGGSPAPVLPYHLATAAPLLSGLLDQLGYQQADVLGISWGGGLAQQFALRCPARVRRLVLVATAPGALMVPGSPASCCACSPRGATRTPAMRPASPVSCSAAAPVRIPHPPATCCTR